MGWVYDINTVASPNANTNPAMSASYSQDKLVVSGGTWVKINLTDINDSATTDL